MWPDMTRSIEAKSNKLNLSQAKRQTDAETNLLTHLRADAVSDEACLDMTSIKALVVSENLETSTGVGTLRTKYTNQMKDISPTFLN